MDRQRLIEKIKTLEAGDSTYQVIKELGRGGNGVALLCHGPEKKSVVAKVYIPPDSRDLDDKALERFENEIALTQKLTHPNIIRSLGSGTLTVGAYRLPFYLMPQADGTLRNEIRADTDANLVERKLRMFTRAAYGVACLHSHGIVHRDLKPENILLTKSGIPWVADLGIAHVNPEFVSVGLKTIESERLLNRDYYAPEQRFGQATAVDHRADVYALGCILYEILTSIPPVRTNAPQLTVISSAYKPLEPIWTRMVAWDAANRYQSIEDALEDLAIAFGWVLATLRGSAGLQHPDIPTMVKLLRSSNEAQRQRGIELATKLGKSALSELHNLIGHTRRDIRNSAAAALARIGDQSSVPYLIGGLYGSTNRPSQFRPTVDIAAKALRSFDEGIRLAAIKTLEYPIRPIQIVTILEGIDPAAAYDAADYLRRNGLILTDWSESELEIFVAIDESRAWPEVKALVDKEVGFAFRNLYRYLSSRRQAEIMVDAVERGAKYNWDYEWLANAALRLNCDASTKRVILDMLYMKIVEKSGSFRERDELLAKVVSGIDRLRQD